RVARRGSAKADVDDLSPRRGLNRLAVLANCGKTGRVQNALRDVEGCAFTGDAKHADRADLDRPIHTARAGTVVADRANDPSRPEAMVSEVAVDPAAVEGVEEQVVRIGRIGIGAVAVAIDGRECAAAADALSRSEAPLRDEIVAVVREVRR